MKRIPERKFEQWTETAVKSILDIAEVHYHDYFGSTHGLLLDVRSVIDMAEFFDRLDKECGHEVSLDNRLHVMSLMLNYVLLMYIDGLIGCKAFRRRTQISDIFMLDEFIDSGFTYWQTEFDDFRETIFPGVIEDDILGEIVDQRIHDDDSFIHSIILQLFDDERFIALTCDHEGYAIASHLEVKRIGTDIIHVEVLYNDLE